MQVESELVVVLELPFGGDVGVEAVADAPVGSPRIAPVRVEMDGRPGDRHRPRRQIELLERVHSAGADVETPTSVPTVFARRGRGERDGDQSQHCYPESL